MAQRAYPGTIPARQHGGSADPDALIRPIRQAEVRDLLYKTDRPFSERFEALMSLRKELNATINGDGDSELTQKLGEIDVALALMERTRGVMMPPGAEPRRPRQ